MAGRLTLYIFLAPVLLWLFLLIVLPHIDLFFISLQAENDMGDMVWSLSNYEAFFTEKIYWLTFLRTAVYAILTTILTFLITFPIAFYITKVVSLRVSGFFTILLLVPFWVSELVRIYGWMILLRESGVFNHYLMQLGLIDKPIEMLYNDISMIMGDRKSVV